MVYAQVGAWVPNCWLALIGGFFGALSYGFLEPVLGKVLLRCGPQGPAYVYIDKASAAHVESGKSRLFYMLASLALGIGCIAFSAVLEVLIPFQQELRTLNEPD